MADASSTGPDWTFWLFIATMGLAAVTFVMALATIGLALQASTQIGQARDAENARRAELQITEADVPVVTFLSKKDTGGQGWFEWQFNITNTGDRPIMAITAQVDFADENGGGSVSQSIDGVWPGQTKLLAVKDAPFDQRPQMSSAKATIVSHGTFGQAVTQVFSISVAAMYVGRLGGMGNHPSTDPADWMDIQRIEIAPNIPGAQPVVTSGL